MLMRLNLDKVKHPIHCYYPASGKVYFDRLRYGAVYHEVINVIEHPIIEPGVVHDDGTFKIEAIFLEHGIDNIGWRVTEADSRKFDKKRLETCGVQGPLVRKLEAEGSIKIEGKTVTLDDVSTIRKGDSIAVVIDTLMCTEAVQIAQGARILLCESTFLEEHRHLAEEYHHLTALQAAEIAREAGVQELILTHFSARYTDLTLFENEARAIFPNTQVAEDFKVFPFPKKP